ncbi:MAG: beta-N-acetylhexosaminidase [Flavicella sp.]
MRFFRPTYILLLLLLSFNSQAQNKYTEATNRALNLLPTPKNTILKKGVFQLNSKTKIIKTLKAAKAITFLQQKLSDASGYTLKTSNRVQKNTVVFEIDSLQIEEGYALEINNKNIRITANSDSGFFYGIQSLLQLMSPEIYSRNKVRKDKWVLAQLDIKDAPKHRWRSFMLDSGREYQSVPFIKKYLDYMAFLKMNVFHWHLTEGKGWRIEIKKYPKLTSVGATLGEGSSKGKFYSQEDIKEIVNYAASRNIEVVPEIDVPGHSEAALIAYPEYSCLQKAPNSKMTFSANLFCGGRESTYTFLTNVFEEVCALFPSEYIHIGGDEAPKAIWKTCPHCQKRIQSESLKNEHELQIYFSNRIAKFLKTKGKKAICWGDVLHQEGPELEDNIVVYWWNWRRHKRKALEASIAKNIPLICGTNYYNYLNFPITPWSKYKKNRTFDLKKIYLHNPSNLSDIQIKEAGNILGMGTCLWTDWNVKQHMIDKRVFPRIYAISEQMWSKTPHITFENFYKKIQHQYTKLRILGVDYGPALTHEVPLNYNWN